MFLVQVVYRCIPGKREIFCKEVFDSGFIDAARNEKGNIRYEYYFPLDFGDDVFLLEQWGSAADWEAHKRTPHVQELQPIKARYVLETIVETFTVSKV